MQQNTCAQLTKNDMRRLEREKQRMLTDVSKMFNRILQVGKQDSQALYSFVMHLPSEILL